MEVIKPVTCSQGPVNDHLGKAYLQRTQLLRQLNSFY